MPNEVAVELAGIGDGVLESLRDRLRCTIHLRGNRLTIEGDEAHVDQARTVIDEIVELVEGGHEIGPSTVDAVLGVLDKGEVKGFLEYALWLTINDLAEPWAAAVESGAWKVRLCRVNR